ncbi:baseplate J/gp47 family protein [Cellulomonas sp. URHE0023]|uniref:baseplate J/gp47 family protein n=1 Tax=Cellulomonas sp. URHE0023 TaxID=1380354 RepID=UPI00068DB14F|nr:baseplate J/gp47 family protein [Cellulomonas sp. URHE0023]
MSCGCSACAAQVDPLKLVRTGTDQVQRSFAAPDAPGLRVDERRSEHAMVFASAYAAHLPFHDPDGAEDATWESFFTADTSARFAAAATEDVAVYRTTVQELLRRLEDPELPASGADMKRALGAVFDCVGTLALRLDTLGQRLERDEPLRATLANLVRSRLSPVLRQLIGFYLAGAALGVVDRAAQPIEASLILGMGIEPFDSLLTGPGLSSDWPRGVGLTGWGSYIAVDLSEPTGAYGDVTDDVARVNHLATHNVFTSACETFLAVYARAVDDAGAALLASIHQSGHQPHYALFLAFLQLLDHARAAVNTFTQKHLDFYYEQVLRLGKHPAEPSRAHVVVELAKHVDSHLLESGTLLKAGAGVQFSLDRDLVANKATVTALKSLYRHRASSTSENLPEDGGRIFASPVADDVEPWHPFAKQTYADGRLRSIDMPVAEIGFAIASHYLWLAEGTRTVTVDIQTTTALPDDASDGLQGQLRCRLTTEKGWLEVDVPEVAVTDKPGLEIVLAVMPNDPAITAYDPKVHGYGFDTAQPVLLVTLRHDRRRTSSYPVLAAGRAKSIALATHVEGIKTLVLANDHGPIDPSTPFLPFGSAPTSNSSLVIGSKEAFQKSPTAVDLEGILMARPVVHPAGKSAPTMSVEYLDGGTWHSLLDAESIAVSSDDGGVEKMAVSLGAFDQPPVTTPDLTPGTPYSPASRGGFVRLKLSAGYGVAAYPVSLAAWFARPDGAQPIVPVVPLLGSFTLGYDAVQQIDLAAPSEASGRFFHVTPFGYAEQSMTNPSVVPQFVAGANEPSEGELYVGVEGLVPPQNLALLFRVVEGTASPRTVKPEHHLRWSYLRGTQWVGFPADAVSDLTDGLLASGIVTLALPADATTEHTLMARGQHWIRIAVASATDAVSHLRGVAAQAVRATSRAPEESPTPAVDLPAGAISKLETPDAAVRSVGQPDATFGGRPVEDERAFATRVSERLRHKDRAIALWDYEHLVLEAFPGVYQVRCLNHTLYGPTSCGAGEYQELAPGHVTVVTIPDLAVPDPRDPLRPFTSLRVLREIERFLRVRMSCFAQLHVRNPQFEEVSVALRVRLRDGFDETFHHDRLKREIVEFLSPWAYRAGARPQFNGTVHKSVLVNFIEERPYVDYVSDVRLYRKLPDAAPEHFPETVVGSTAISILVSAPADGHTVEAIPGGAAALVEDCGCEAVVSS